MRRHIRSVCICAASAIVDSNLEQPAIAPTMGSKLSIVARNIGAQYWHERVCIPWAMRDDAAAGWARFGYAGDHGRPRWWRSFNSFTNIDVCERMVLLLARFGLPRPLSRVETGCRGQLWGNQAIEILRALARPFALRPWRRRLTCRTTTRIACGRRGLGRHKAT